MEKKSSTRILGIDPGTNILGFAVLEVKDQKMYILEIGVVKMSHFSEQPEKLKTIFERTREIIKKYRPGNLAIEAPFYAKNIQSMLKLGRAQGVAIAAGITAGLDITEYSPKKIKQSVTGNGNASKEQVAAMLETIFHQKLQEEYFDATDALATAVCHHFQSTSRLGQLKGKGGWKNFLNENPDRHWKP